MKELEYPAQSVPKDKRFCTICGKIKRLQYFEGDSTHCSACCEKMLHTHMPGWSVPVVLVVLLIAAASVILSVQTVPYCVNLLRADAAMRDKHITTACNRYADAVSDASVRNSALVPNSKPDEEGSPSLPKMLLFEPGTRTWRHYLEAYAVENSEYGAAVLAKDSLHVNAEEVIPEIAHLNVVRKAYDETTEFAKELDKKYPFDAVEDMPYDEILAELTAYADASDSPYVKGYTEYYKGTATLYYKTDDPAAAIPYFEKVLEYVPNAFLAAYTAEAQAAMRAGDFKTVLKVYEAILEKNKDYTDAYPTIAEAAFRTGNTDKLKNALEHYDEDDPLRLQMEMRFALRSDDLEEAAQIRKRANETIYVKADQIFNKMLAEQSVSSSDAAILLGYVEYAMYDAAYSLVRGDIAEALDLTYQKAFNYAYYYAYISGDSSSAFTQTVLNMTTLCASWANDKEAIDAIGAIGACDETTQKAIDDKLTAREIFVEGKAEIL